MAATNATQKKTYEGASEDEWCKGCLHPDLVKSLLARRLKVQRGRVRLDGGWMALVPIGNKLEWQLQRMLSKHGGNELLPSSWDGENLQVMFLGVAAAARQTPF